MNELIRSTTAFQLLCGFARHVATIAPAASFWTSGIGVSRSQEGDETTRIVCLLMLFVSAGVSAIIHWPAFKRANFDLVVPILAVVCVARELLKFSTSSSPLERLKTCMWEYGSMLWCIAVAILLAHHWLSTRSVDELLSLAELSQASFKKHYIQEWRSDRDIEDGNSTLERLSTAGSFYTKYIVGPSSLVSGRSNSSGTGISLPSNAPCPDTQRTSRLKQILSQFSLSMKPSGSDSPLENTHGLDITLDG